MRDLKQIENTTYDLIIIGGGINGAGVARDAALRGLKTILIEKNDFAGGTSSWSTRLIHGGLRYLEYFEFPLVRESLKEREVLLKNAPHLVTPLLLTVPVYQERSRPYWKIWAGMILYDIFSYDKSLPIHRMLSKAKFGQLFRHLDPENLVGGSQYYDAQATYAERLCLENIISAQQAGATVLNYVTVTELDIEGQRIKSLVCKDSISGNQFTIQGSEKSIVINTGGPWVDKICQLGVKQGEKTPIGKKKKIGGTKGSHIVVGNFSGAPTTALYVEAKTDRRPFFIVPWLGMYLIGTTDLYYNGPIDNIKADDEEIDYLLRETNNIIPTAHLGRDDVKFTYSGVRPLPNEEGKKPGSVTRKHIIFDHSKEGVTNLLSLIGGKLTTYRNVGEEMVDIAYKKMGKTAPPCKTSSQPLPGCVLPKDKRLEDAINSYGDSISLQTIHHLFTMYGANAVKVLELVEDKPELGELIHPNLPDIKAQIVFAVNSEMAYTLLDILRRRTTLAMQGEYGLHLLPTVTDVLQRYCDWSHDKCLQQVQDYRRYMESNCIPDYQIAITASLPDAELVAN